MRPFLDLIRGEDAARAANLGKTTRMVGTIDVVWAMNARDRVNRGAGGAGS